jgi:hypothetical protein
MKSVRTDMKSVRSDMMTTSETSGAHAVKGRIENAGLKKKWQPMTPRRRIEDREATLLEPLTLPCTPISRLGVMDAP